MLINAGTAKDCAKITISLVKYHRMMTVNVNCPHPLQDFNTQFTAIFRKFVMKDRTSYGTCDLNTLYDAAFDGNLLKTLVAMLGSVLPAEVAVVLFTNERGQSGCSVLLQHDPHTPARPLGHDLGQDHWTTVVGSVYHDRDLTSGPRRAGVLDCAVGIVLSRTADTQTVLELRYPFANTDKLRAVLFERLKGLAPDLERALRIMALRCQDAQKSRIALGVLELLPFPAFVLGGDGVVQKLNARAMALVGRMDALQMGADQTLHAVDTVSDAALWQALVLMATRHPQRAHTLAVSTLDPKKRRFLTLTRLTGAEALTNGFCLPGTRHGADLVVIVHECAEPLSISHDTLWHTFEMNSKEVDLALSLLNGESIGDYASRRNLSKQTLRNQLTGILRKTDTSRQSELVGLLTRLALSPVH